ncbi:MAG: rubredoxin [Desulfovibrio sp.]|nr:rubredoxin [Desulfovibrio sp.]
MSWLADTRVEDLPDDWRCPVCGVDRKAFRRLSD